MFSPIILQRIWCPVRRKHVGLKIGVRSLWRAYFAEVRRTTCRLTKARRYWDDLIVVSDTKKGGVKREFGFRETAMWTKLYKFGCKDVCIRSD